MTDPVEHPKRQIRVLHVVPSFYPATYWGGPIFSTKAICDGVAELPDMSVRVLTTDSAGPSRGDNLRMSQRQDSFEAGYTVYYARRVAGHSIAPGLVKCLGPMMAWADVVHLTATYSFPTLPTMMFARVLSKPLIWSPRGALQASEEWDEAPNMFAKTLFERVCRLVRPGRTVFHVTAQVEKETSLRRMPGVDAEVIPNAIYVPSMLPARVWRPQGRMRLMFLSRVHESKGLDVLVDALTQLPDEVTLDVYGGGDPSYVRALHVKIEEVGVSSRVTFHGHVEGSEKRRAFLSADLFVLPTRSENFGIAVAEALAHGVPVITTRAAPWASIETKRCGAWIESGPEALAAAVRRLMASDLEAAGRRGRAWIRADFAPGVVALRMAALYRRVVNGRRRRT